MSETLKQRVKHWWQRNFGCVYLRDRRGQWYRFRARRGRVALVWVVPFVCRLSPDGRVVNWHDRDMRGYGQQHDRWTWDYEPHSALAGDGGAW